MRILIIAYACEPNSGSEPGTGWNTALELSREFDVTVVTRANNEHVIEADPERKTREKLSFIYHDISDFWIRLKKKGILSTQVYYGLWHWMLRKKLRDTNDFDVVHHLTFNSFEVPPFALKNSNAKIVWGPIGGGQTAPGSLLPTLSFLDGLKERFRSLRVQCSSWNPFVRSMLWRCDAVLFANRETRQLLLEHCRGITDTMIDVGVDPSVFSINEVKAYSKTVLFAGRFEARKGVMFLLEAFALAYHRDNEIKLKMLGDGPSFEEAQSKIDELGLGKAVSLLGRVGHEQMSLELGNADVFAFPSLRDTSGAIVLEAMASGLPVVCLDHQGASIMVGDTGGRRIVPGELDDTRQEFADAILELIHRDSASDHSDGADAHTRVANQFSWSHKAERLIEVYRSVL